MSQINKKSAILFFLLVPPFFLANAKSGNEIHYEVIAKQRYQSIYISGHYADGVKHGDSIKITFWKDLFTANYNSKFTPHRNLSALIKDGNFKVTIDSVNSVSYISLSAFNDKWGGAYDFLNFYLAEPGDSIHLNMSNIAVAKPLKNQTEFGDSICVNCTSIIFSGRGAAKYNCRFKMDRAIADSRDVYNSEETKQEYKNIRAYEQKGLKYPVISLPEYSKKCQKEVDYIEKTPFEVLNFYKYKLDNNIYQVLRANLIGEIQEQFYARPMFFTMTASHMESIEDYKKLYASSYYKKTYGVSDVTALNSIYYLDFLIAKSKLEDCLFNINLSNGLSSSEKYQFRIVSTYYFIKSRYSGILKDKILLSYLINHSSFVGDPAAFINDGINTIKTQRYLDLLNSFSLSTQVGKKAYNFTLPDSTDKNISLDQCKGKVVFIDFWFSGCNGCANYYKDVVSNVEQDYKNNSDVVFISISIDADKNVWRNSVLSNKYTSAGVINLYKAGSSPIIKQFMVLSYPHPLLIDRNGLIFCNSNTELRVKGIASLENKINQALALK